MVGEAANPKPPLTVGDSMEFHYQKTPQYRVYHSDGCIGGPTPRGQFSLSFFSERPPIPKVGKRTIISSSDSQATMGPEEPCDVLSGVVRQVELTVMMDLRAAQEFYQFFGEQLTLMERTMGVAADDRVTKDS